MSAPPIIPQRPTRHDAQQPMQSNPSSTLEPPKIPPRPAGRADRSISRDREGFTRSPLNELPISMPPTNGFHAARSNDLQRKPSVAALPGLGEEGNEYSSMPSGTSPTHTRNVAGDLPLHAPKAGISSGHQTSISNLTRSDASSAAAPDAVQPHTQHSSKPPSIKAHSPLPTPRSRPESTYEMENEHKHGIPHLGPYVPMYPDAGDVQAPSPAPFSPQPTGVGYFNDGSRPGSSSHGRRRSAQLAHLPPGSYGLHGHGVMPHDQFEQSWYSKHPQERAKEEQGAYGPINTPRGEYSLSSDDLNKLVRSSSRGPGFGTSPAAIAIPPDSIGYMASQEYAARIASPRPAALQKTRSLSHGQQHAESPLRKASFPAELQDDHDLDQDVIHIDPPMRRHDKYHGGGYDPPTEDLGPQGGNTSQLGGFITEEGRGTPILASDEVRRNPASEYMQPAIEPPEEQTGDGEYMAGMDSHANPAYQSGLRNRSREPSRTRSRPTSIHEHSGHGHGLTRWASHGVEGTGTPLEDVEEYEPLFDDEDEKSGKPLTAADRFKRPQLETHRFPSQDIWEDTPESLQLSSVATREQEEEEAKDSPVTTRAPASAFETPEQEAKRRGEITESERMSFLTDPSKGFAKPKFSAGIQDEMTTRPGMRHRFPSQDIWEDSPDSQMMTTTIDPAEEEATSTVRSPTTSQEVPAQNKLAQAFGAIDPALAAPQEKPQVPARPAHESETIAVQSQPTVPARPIKKIDQIIPEQVPDLPTQTKEAAPAARQVPSIPDRPKPQVPARPAKAVQPSAQPRELESTVESIKEASAAKEATDVPIAAKQKPSVPSKIASLKANFMDQLNNRLALGPQAPPKPQPLEPEAEAAPLSDARRGRAKGPARRTAVKPEAEAGPITSTPSSTSTSKFSITQPMHHWSVDPTQSHHIIVGTRALAPSSNSSAHFDEQPTTSSIANTIAGEMPQQASETSSPSISSSGALAHPPNHETDARASAEEAQKSEDLQSFEEDKIGHANDVPRNEGADAMSQTIGAVPSPHEQEKLDIPGAFESEETLESKGDDVEVAKPLLAGVDTDTEDKGNGMTSQAVQTGAIEIRTEGQKVTAYQDQGVHPVAETVVVREEEESVV